MIESDLVPRLIASDAECVAGRLGIIARRPGNPFGAAIRHDGELRAFRCAVIARPSFNRAIGLSEATADRVAELTAWLQEAGRHGRVEVAACLHGATLGRTLAVSGWMQTGFSGMFAATPSLVAPPTRVAVTTVRTAEEMEVFLEAHLAGWGIPEAHRDGAKENMRQWLGLPGWTMLIGRLDGVAAGTAVLHVADGVAYCADAATRPEWRARGVQSALLHHRRKLAAALGAEIVWSAAAFPSQSARNMRRAGFALLTNVAIWQR